MLPNVLRSDIIFALQEHQSLCYICVIFLSRYILNSLLNSGTLGYPTGVAEK